MYHPQMNNDERYITRNVPSCYTIYSCSMCYVLHNEAYATKKRTVRLIGDSLRQRQRVQR